MLTCAGLCCVQVMGCAMMLPLGMSPDGARVAEIGAFCVDVVFRGTGRGDSLLDYVEQVGLVPVFRE
jgi:amino-acid N-acetyltransferase